MSPTADALDSALFVEKLEVHNFKGLRDSTVPLSRFTVLVGPNGSGKTTVLQALQAVGRQTHLDPSRFGTVDGDHSTDITIVLHWVSGNKGYVRLGSKFRTSYHASEERPGVQHLDEEGRGIPDADVRAKTAASKLKRLRLYSLDANALAAPTILRPNLELGDNGANLAGVLDQLQGRAPERFDALNRELRALLPEFDRVLFEITDQSQKGLRLRMARGSRSIAAADASQGALLSLGILTLAYLPDPPAILCLEEPDRGVHPRLLRYIRDALYRLTHPDEAGEQREPVQVIVTTHSPYFLDLYREHSNEIVIAQRLNGNIAFDRLSERPDIDEILGNTSLGDAWYSGILGGVPTEG